MGAGWPVESISQFNVDVPVSHIDFDDMSLLPGMIEPTGKPDKLILLRR